MFWGFLWESVEKEKLADNLTETVLDFLSGQSDFGCHAEQTAVNWSVLWILPMLFPSPSAKVTPH